MHILFHDVEELPHRRSHDRDGSIAPSFFDTQTLFIDIVYWNRPSTDPLECSILESPLEPIFANLGFFFAWGLVLVGIAYVLLGAIGAALADRSRTKAYSA